MSILSTLFLVSSLVFVNNPTIPIPKEKPSVCTTETDVEIIQISMEHGLSLFIIDKPNDVANFIRAIKTLVNIDTDPESAEKLSKVILVALPDKVLSSGFDETGCEILVGTFTFETVRNILKFIGEKT